MGFRLRFVYGLTVWLLCSSAFKAAVLRSGVHGLGLQGLGNLGKESSCSKHQLVVRSYSVVSTVVSGTLLEQHENPLGSLLM